MSISAQYIWFNTSLALIKHPTFLWVLLMLFQTSIVMIENYADYEHCVVIFLFQGQKPNCCRTVRIYCQYVNLLENIIESKQVFGKWSSWFRKAYQENPLLILKGWSSCLVIVLEQHDSIHKFLSSFSHKPTKFHHQ